MTMIVNHCPVSTDERTLKYKTVSNSEVCKKGNLNLSKTKELILLKSGSKEKFVLLDQILKNNKQIQDREQI